MIEKEWPECGHARAGEVQRHHAPTLKLDLYTAGCEPCDKSYVIAITKAEASG